MASILEFGERKQVLLEELSRLILGEREVENEFEEVWKLGQPRLRSVRIEESSLKRCA
jgi:hypothetical protein